MINLAEWKNEIKSGFIDAETLTELFIAVAKIGNTNLIDYASSNPVSQTKNVHAKQ